MDPSGAFSATVVVICAHAGPRPPEEEIQRIAQAVQGKVDAVSQYVPGYRLKAPVVLDEQDTPWGRRPVITVLLQVEGAGDFLPRYAGNLDIMTSAARRVGERLAATVSV